MIRKALLILLTGLCLATPGWAQGPTETEDGRYSFHRSDDGYLRLDVRTGQVSLCTRRSAGWACQTVADERTALEAEIARLQAENGLLKKELIARNLPLPGSVKPEPAGKDDPRLQLPNDIELNRVMSFIEQVWRRLVDMIVTLQRDVLKKT